MKKIIAILTLTLAFSLNANAQDKKVVSKEEVTKKELSPEVAAKNDAYELYKKTFVNIQKLKDKLPEDELELLNRFMAKVKTNITLIESEKITE